MIVLDIETTGTDPQRHSMLSLGAVDFESGKEFYGECRCDFASAVDPIALQINGFTYEQIEDIYKPYPLYLYLAFYNWSKQFEEKLLGGHNIGHFDVLFCEKYHQECGLSVDKWPFGYRTVDLHSVAYVKLGKSLNHEGICQALGLPIEQKPHNALAGARSEREAFKLLL